MPPDDEKPDEKPEVDPQRLSQWISENLPDDRLMKMARSIARKVRKPSCHLDPRFLGLEDGDLYRRPQGSDPLPDAIASQLILFLSERPNLLAELSAGPDESTVRFLASKFLRHWQDQSRALTSDPERYLYKAARTAISESPQFHFDKDTSTFSRSPEASVKLRLYPDDLNEIPFPAATESFDGEKTRQSATLVRLADHFLAEAARIFEAPDIAVRMEDFVSWIQRHVRQPNPGKNEKADVENWESRIPAPREPAVSPEQLWAWVADFQSILSPEEAQLLLLRFGERLGYREIAGRIGKSGGTAWNRWNKLKEQIRDYWNSLPIEESPSARRLFLDLLLASLEASELKKPKPEP
jgi:hypothetical protein